MELRKITAIIRPELLEEVETRLHKMGVKGVSVTWVKGYGEYTNFFSRDWMCCHAKIEIFTGQDQADVIAAAIMEEAHTGTVGDGIIAVAPVEKMFRIRTKSEEVAGDI